MATKLVVLGENAARINVKVNPNMTVLKVLELACAKWKIDSNDYDLKYHNKILDTTNLIRFTSIANNAILELVPTKKSRLDSPVGVWLQIEDGTRLTGEFLSSQNLWEIIQALLKDKLSDYESPAIIYTRLEIIGKEQLQQKTLKDLGLLSGKALLRLLNKNKSENQAHVYTLIERKPKIEEPTPKHLEHREIFPSAAAPQNSEAKNVATTEQPINQQDFMDVGSDVNGTGATVENEPIFNPTDEKNLDDDNIEAEDTKIKPNFTDEEINNFNNSVSYLDEQNTLLFDIMDGTSVLLYQDVDDDFFEPTIKDIIFMLQDLKNKREKLENSQLSTSAMRELEKAQNQLNLLHKYKKCIIRIHFPNRLVLQSVFKTTETVSDIITFIRKYLVDESLDFYLFTTPPITIMKPEKTLLECGCIPSAMIHFSCSTKGIDYLKPDLKNKIVTGRQASIAAYLVRKERVSNNESSDNQQPGPSQKQTNTQQNNATANIEKKPKWFKPL